jgi:chromosome segregation ATPase
MFVPGNNTGAPTDKSIKTKQDALTNEAGASERLRLEQAKKEKARIEKERADERLRLERAQKEKARIEKEKADERLRLERLKEERARIERERAKAQLSEKKNKREVEKLDLHRREIELQRMRAEVARTHTEMEQYRSSVKVNDGLGPESRNKVFDLEAKILKLQGEITQFKKQIDNLNSDASRARIDNEYKKKLFEKKQEVNREAEMRVKRYEVEMDRIKADIVRLDIEIRALEQKVG